MATVNNPWVSFITRSYTQIKTNILNRLNTLTPELTDRSESNPLIIIVGIFAGIAEMLGYYIDQVARETFVSTARRYSSLAKLAILHDYRIKASIASTVNLLFKLVDGNGDPIAIATPFVIPIDTLVKSGGVEFLTTETVTIAAGETEVIVGAIQKKGYTAQLLGVSDGTANQRFALPATYLEDSLTLTVGTDLWERVDTLGRSISTDKHYIVDVTPEQEIYAVFGDGTYGEIPLNLSNITGDYFLTQGSDGNVEAESITDITTTFVIPAPATELLSINNDASTGGTGLESLEKLRKSIIYTIRTLNRAVTKQDFIDIARLAPGVGKANAFHECGSTVKIYITPVTGGLAQLPLLTSVLAYINNYRLITTTVEVQAAGESFIALNLRVVAKFRRDTAQVLIDVQNALLEAYSTTTSDINKAIYLSDIIALVDNLEKVDYLTLNSIYIIPYARPVSHNFPLYWDVQVTSLSTTKVSWKIVYLAGVLNLYRDNVFNGIITPLIPYTTPQGDLTLTINSTAYFYGNTWEFITYPYNQDTVVDNNTLVLTAVPYMQITVVPTLLQNN